MANLNLNFDFLTKLSEWWTIVKSNFTAINDQVTNHVAGAGDKHSSFDITFSSTRPTLSADDVKEAIEKVDIRIDGIINNPDPNKDLELVDFRTSNIYGAFSTAKARGDNIDSEVYGIKTLSNYEINDKSRKRKPLITFITDDARIEDYTHAKPIFQTEGVPCCTAVITDSVGSTVNFCTKEQLLELQSIGWEMLSHTKTHANLTTLTDVECENEFKLSKQWLLDNGFDVQSLAYPYNQWATREKYFAKKYYRSARSSNEHINKLPMETHELRSIWISNSTDIDPKSGLARNTLAYFQYYIDKAYVDNSWIIIAFHSWDLTDSATQTLLTQVVQYAKTKAPIVTFKDALNQIGNIVESGDFSRADRTKQHFSVSCDGDIHTNGFDIVYKGLNTILPTKPITEFEDNKITISRLSTATAISSSMPTANGGTLYTYKFAIDDGVVNEDHTYNYQRYDALNGEVWTRRSNGSKTWEVWTKVGPPQEVVTIPNINTYVNSTPLSSFPVGVTYSRVSAVNATGLPNNATGVLITYRLHTTAGQLGYNWQEYHIYDSLDIWKRKIDSNGNFGTWTKVSANV